ncbi:calpastatin [Pedobacter sp. Leaf216]|nr:calpastatin [Pedobacter sp. Leaf216]
MQSLKNLDEQELERFISAQERDYARALDEITSGRKQSHWMWYIFPQIQGLGFSDTAKYYAIRDLQQASDYLAHPILGKRLIAISEKLLSHKDLSAHRIFGSPDDVKLCSCMSLFASVPGAPPIFNQIIDQFFSGEKDLKTKRILELQSYYKN